MSFAEVIKVDIRDPDLSKIRQLAVESRGGKLIVFPTETVYGVGAPMSVPNIGRTLAELKGRPKEKPFSYHIGEWEMVDQLQVVSTPAFRHLSRKFWPGPVTLIIKNKDGEKIGLRFPRHRLATALINAAGEPFVATSANLSGKASPRNAAEALAGLGEGNYSIIDGGPCELALDSTVIDVSEESPVILRQGAYAQEVKDEIQNVMGGRYMRKRILVVCTGNSCRSPMAEGLLIDTLRKKDLADQIAVSSCGIAARSSGKATTEAILVMKNLEIDISNHRSKPCTREDVNQADLILCMAKEHAEFITNLMPQAKSKIRVMNVVDPIGMNLLIYEAVLADIEKKFKNIWNDIIA